MRGYDFSPFARSAIGFEHLFDMLNDRESVNNDTYPPYDIVRTGEDSSRSISRWLASRRKISTSPAKKISSRSPARNPITIRPNTSIKASQHARSNAASTLQTTSR